jgi:hypothetical protein
LLISKPVTLKYLDNSIAKGKPTYPRPTTQISGLYILSPCCDKS